MRSIAVVAVASLLGCNGVLGLDERDRAQGDSGDAAPLVDVGGIDGSGIDGPATDTTGSDAPPTIDGEVDTSSTDAAMVDTTPPTWCETEPAHAYCEDFDRGHVLAFLETGGATASVGVPAKTLPKALACKVAASSTANAAVLQIPVTTSSREPKIAVDVMFDVVSLATDGDIDIVQVQMLTTSYRLVYQKRAGTDAKLTVAMVFGSGTTGSIGVGTVSTGWSRISMDIENATGSSPRLVVRVDGVQRGATGAGNLADSAGLFQIQKLVIGGSAPAGNTVPLVTHLDDVTLDL